MRSSQRVLTVLLVVCGLGVVVAVATADIVSVLDPNLLSGQSAAATSFYWLPTYPLSAVTDGASDPPFLFQDGAGDESLAIDSTSGSAISLIRIWYDSSETYRTPAQVTVYSSTTNQELSLSSSQYENTAATLPSLTYNGIGSPGYINVSTSIPTGTKSLLLDFGSKDLAGTTDGIWITEVQAFNTPAPEPSAIIMLAIGLISLLAYAWRKRRQ